MASGGLFAVEGCHSHWQLSENIKHVLLVGCPTVDCQLDVSYVALCARQNMVTRFFFYAMFHSHEVGLHLVV